MFGFKKKLSALVPSEGARNALQNVLTVEWEGQGKTVLVEVPSASSMRNSEMEMDGLGGASGDQRNTGGYGRLEDDDDRQYLSSGYNARSAGFDSSRFESPSSSEDHSRSTSRDRRHSHSKNGNQRGLAPPPRLPSRPSFNRPEIDNPFDEGSGEYPSDAEGNNAPYYHNKPRPALPSRNHSAMSDYAGSFGGGGGGGGSGMQSGYSSSSDPLSDDGYTVQTAQHGQRSPARGTTVQAKKPWATFDEHPNRQVYPAGQMNQSGKKVDPWTAGGWSAATSPTSSRGTRTSARDAEDPFA